MALHHVPGARQVLDAQRRALAEGGDPARGVLGGQVEVAVHRVDQQQRAAHVLPELRGEPEAERVGTGRSVQRVVLELVGAVGAERRALAGQAQSELARQAAIGLDQALGGLGKALVAARRQLADARPGVQPGAHALGERHLLGLGRAQTLQHRQAVDALGEAAGVVADDAAAHRVPDQRHPLTAELADHLVQIGQVVHEVVVATRPDAIAVPVAAQVGGDQVKAPAQARRHRLVPGVGVVEEAVHQHDRVDKGRLVGPPLEQVIGEAGGELDPA